MLNNFKKTGIVSKNSLDYVDAIFNCYLNDEKVVLLRACDDKRVEMLDVERIYEPKNKFGWFKKHYDFRRDSELAQISFTSGTEGEPKGVLLTHEALDDVTQRLNQVMEVDDSIREYVGIPANFSFGFGRFRAVSAAGGFTFLPQNGFDPIEIQKMLFAGEINSISAVPSLWRVLLKSKDIFGEERFDLKWIEIGSQYMSMAEKKELRALFPKAKIAQHYGLTEASRTSFLRLDQAAPEDLESVGRAYGNTELKISDTGRICIRGPHLSQTLYKEGQLVSNLDDEGWFHTSDLGNIKGDYLYYLGRADDQINCNGIKLNPDTIERELRERLSIKDGVAVGSIEHDLYGQAVLIAAKKELDVDNVAFAKAAFDILADKGVQSSGAIKFIRIEEFPLTSTNKVKRKLLADYVNTESLFEVTTSEYQAPRNDLEFTLCSVWSRVLNREKVGIEDNFFQLGGDSLTAMKAIHEMSLATGTEIELGDLFSFPTIKLLSELLQSNNKDKPMSSVVPLKQGQADLSFFCLCGLNLYQELANAMPMSSSVYGVYVAQEDAFFKELLNKGVSSISTDALANAYAEAILRFQKAGPYRLLGISFGGLVALETAISLTKLGHEVELVVMLDTILPSKVSYTFSKKIKRLLTKLASKVGKVLTVKQEVNLDKLKKDAYHQALKQYQKMSGEYQGKIVLIKAKDRSEWGDGVGFLEDYGWTELLERRPDVFELAGSHLDIIKPPLSQDVANILQKVSGADK
jgi:acyl-CoA synthetase (AMP-forming)/AMP-acid ligase II/thioesterase domain-containing protein/aryl carrier-like protein